MLAFFAQFPDGESVVDAEVLEEAIMDNSDQLGEAVSSSRIHVLTHVHML